MKNGPTHAAHIYTCSIGNESKLKIVKKVESFDYKYLKEDILTRFHNHLHFPFKTDKTEFLIDDKIKDKDIYCRASGLIVDKDNIPISAVRIDFVKL